jgi:hypothetical protein
MMAVWERRVSYAPTAVTYVALVLEQRCNRLVKGDHSTALAAKSVINF